MERLSYRYLEENRIIPVHFITGDFVVKAKKVMVEAEAAVDRTILCNGIFIRIPLRGGESCEREEECS